MSRASLRLLVTGFSHFPGAPRNPTESLMHRLAQARPRLGRLGIDLHCTVLPVVYARMPACLENLLSQFKPDGVLHFGLAARRTFFSIETRAVNHCSPLRPDAQGDRPARSLILNGSPFVLHSRYPAQAIVAALNQSRIPSRLSYDAGDYLCNMALYLSCHSGVKAAGFVHVPRSIRLSPDSPIEPVTPALMDHAAMIAIIESVRALHLKQTLEKAD